MPYPLPTNFEELADRIMSNLSLADRIAIRDFVFTRFVIDEFRDLMFTLGMRSDVIRCETIQQAAREIVEYCERTSQPSISCLLAAILQVRPDEGLARIAAKLPGCIPNRIVQIILATNTIASESALIADIAQLAQKYPDQIVLLGTLPGSTKVLIGLPEDGADQLISSNPSGVGNYRVISINRFEELDADVQQLWLSIFKNSGLSKLDAGIYRRTSVRLYVGNLAYSTTDAMLRQFFSEAGEVKSAEVVIERTSGRSKGFGFVEMMTDEAAQKAINILNGKMLDMRPIRIDIAAPKLDRPRSGLGNRGTGNHSNRNVSNS